MMAFLKRIKHNLTAHNFARVYYSDGGKQFSYLKCPCGLIIAGSIRVETDE